MRNLLKNSFSLITAGIFLLAGCEDDPSNPVKPNEQEKITTIVVKLNKIGATPGDTLTFMWNDPDGEGGNTPTRIDTIVLETGASYNGMIQVRDESKTPAVDLTEEIKEEKNSHQFFYTFLNVTNIGITREDFDTNTPPLPIGLEFKITTAGSATAATNAALNIALSHYDGIAKSASRSPETDIDITFPVKLMP
ncbi:MAG TPA: hypothetical protein VEC36_04420 [Patescibacteria group bacterium]|nr:hypothetical protein [Patescibacteria group bacterium]